MQSHPESRMEIIIDRVRNRHFCFVCFLVFWYFSLINFYLVQSIVVSMSTDDNLVGIRLSSSPVDYLKTGPVVRPVLQSSTVGTRPFWKWNTTSSTLSPFATHPGPAVSRLNLIVDLFKFALAKKDWPINQPITRLNLLFNINFLHI